MTASVVKLPKVYRVAQRWVAECESCAGKLNNVKVNLRLRAPGYEPWRGLQRRSAGTARTDADRHNRENHA